MLEFIWQNLQKLSQILDFFLASILLTVILMMTWNKWRWVKDFSLILLWSTLSGYLFSTAVRNYLPFIYGLSEQFWNTVSSVGVFILLLYIMEKDLWKQAVDRLLKSKNITK